MNSISILKTGFLSPNAAADIIFGILGCLVSLVLFLHPLPTCLRSWLRGNSGDLQPYPYMAAQLFSILLSNYAMSSDNGERTTFKYYCLYHSSNVGFLVENLYILIFTLKNPKLQWYTIFFVFSMYGVIILTPIIVGDWLKLIVGENRNKVLGPLIIVAGIFMYTSPLFAIVRAYNSKRTESLPFLLCIILSCYGLTWTIYACLPVTFDLYVSVTNGIGTILSVLLFGVSYATLVKLRKFSVTDRDAMMTQDDDVERPRRLNINGELGQHLLNL